MMSRKELLLEVESKDGQEEPVVGESAGPPRGASLGRPLTNDYAKGGLAELEHGSSNRETFEIRSGRGRGRVNLNLVDAPTLQYHLCKCSPSTSPPPLSPSHRGAVCKAGSAGEQKPSAIAKHAHNFSNVSSQSPC